MLMALQESKRRRKDWESPGFAARAEVPPWREQGQERSGFGRKSAGSARAGGARRGIWGAAAVAGKGCRPCPQLMLPHLVRPRAGEPSAPAAPRPRPGPAVPARPWPQRWKVPRAALRARPCATEPAAAWVCARLPKLGLRVSFCKEQSLAVAVRVWTEKHSFLCMLFDSL